MTLAVWGNEVIVRTTASTGSSVSVDRPTVAALPNGGYVIGWREGTAVKLQVYNGGGIAVGGVQTVETGTAEQGFIRIQASGTEGNFVVNWSVRNGQLWDVKGREFHINGSVGNVFPVAGNVGDPTSVSAMSDNAGGRYAEATIMNNAIWFSTFDSANDVRINIHQDANLSGPSVAQIGSNKFVVSYTQGSNGSETVRYRIVENGSPSAEVTVAAGKMSEVVALKNADGNPDGQFAIVRQNGESVIAQFYNASGAAGETATLTQGLNNGDYMGATALRGGRIAIAYSKYTLGPDGRTVDNGDIFLRIVQPDGTIVTFNVDRPLNSRAALDGSAAQRSPTITELEDGRIVVAWHDESFTGGATSGSSIWSVIVDPRLAPVTVEGTNGVNGTAGHDYYVGSEHNGDILRGNDGNDTLWGGGGDDFLNGGKGGDSFNGGAGFDIVSYFGDDTGVVANLTDPTKNMGSALGDRYTLVEGLRGGGGKDTLTGNGERNSLEGGIGDDTLYGGAGNDTIFGEAGGDRLYGGAGADTLDGGAAANWDTVSYQDAGASIVLDLMDATGASNKGDALGDHFINIDAFIGSSFSDTLIGGTGYDAFFGDKGGDLLRGGEGDVRDDLYGQDGDDTLEGGAGNDRLFGGDDFIGFDYASYAGAGTGVRASLMPQSQNTGDAAGDYYESIEGLIGSNFNDTLEGSDVDNVLMGGAGADELNGGGGTDFASYDLAGGAVTVDFHLGRRTGEAEGDTYISIEGVIGSRYADTLISDEQRHILRGGAGNDTLIGGAGNDTLDGGDGSDTVSYATAGAGVTVNLASGRGAGSDAAGDSYASIENVIGSNFADTFFGNAAVNVFQGGAGDDVYYVGAGDIVIENGYSGNDKVVTDANYTLGANIQSLEGTGSGALVLTGNGLNNTITGNAAGNWIDGGAGADTMAGGAGDDTYVIDNVGDRIIDDLGVNSVVLTVNYDLSLLPASVRKITMTEGLPLNLTGTNGANVLMGNIAVNTLKGQGGDDTIYGKAGNDKLYGGSGRDTFIFDTRPNKSTNVDKIYDFKSRDDSIWLDNAVFTKLGRAGSEARPKKFSSDMFVNGTRAQDREDRIVYDKKTGSLYYDADGTGRTAQVKIATITNKTTLKFDDFFVI